MFNNLLESKPRSRRRRGGTCSSVVFHSVALISRSYAHGKRGESANEKPKQEKIEFVEMKKDEPPPPKEEPPPPPPPNVVVAPPPPKGFQVLTAPVEIPTSFPTST